MNETALYDRDESFKSGLRGEDYTYWGGPGGRLSASSNIFYRYILYPTQFVFKKYWRVVRVLSLKDIEKISFWYSMDGGKAQVFIRNSQSTVILSTGHPEELAAALEKLGVKIEVSESAIQI